MVDTSHTGLLQVQKSEPTDQILIEKKEKKEVCPLMRSSCLFQDGVSGGFSIQAVIDHQM